MTTPLSGRTRSARKAKRSTLAAAAADGDGGPSPSSSSASSAAKSKVKAKPNKTKAMAAPTPRRRTRSTSASADHDEDFQKLAGLAEARVAARQATTARSSSGKASLRKTTVTEKTSSMTKKTSTATPPGRSMSDDVDEAEDLEVTTTAGTPTRSQGVTVEENGTRNDDDDDDDNGGNNDDHQAGVKKGAQPMGTVGAGSEVGGEVAPSAKNSSSTASCSRGGGRGRRGRGASRKCKKALADSPQTGDGKGNVKGEEEVNYGADKTGDKNGAAGKGREEEVVVSPLPTRPDQQMDVTVHRIRHLNYIPRAVHRLAATPIPHKNFGGFGGNAGGTAEAVAAAAASSYIAVSREGGAVELLAVDEKWRTVASVPGLRDREVDDLTWICGHGRHCGSNMGMDIEIDDEKGERRDGTVAPTTTYSYPAHEESCRIHSTRRLFGASRDGTIFEVDFQARRHSHVTPTGGDGVLCLESICPECLCSNNSGDAAGMNRHVCGGYLAAGCGDGSIKIYRVYDDEDDLEGGTSRSKTLNLVSTLPSAGNPVLSLSWKGGARVGRGDVLGGSILYAGVADGTIRRYDCLSAVGTVRASGTSAHSISTGSVLSAAAQSDGTFRWRSSHRMTVETLGRRSATKVWSVKSLSDGTVVSADSLGNVHFWDGHSGTLMCQFVQNENRSDVLDLAVSANECKVFASGVDCRVICIERIPRASALSPSCSYQATRPTSHPSDSQWVQTQAQRPHTHDVKSLCICHMKDSEGAAGAKPNAKGHGRELLVSGGIDTKLCTYLVSNFRKHRAKKLFPWPTSTPVSVARDRRILALMRSDRIDIYSLESSDPLKPDSLHPPRIVDEDKTLIGSIGVSSLYNLVCADISSDGHLLAASDGANLMVFSLNYVADEASEDQCAVLVATKLKVPKKARSACSAVKFANDGSGRLFCATNKGSVNVIQVVNKDKTIKENYGDDYDDEMETAEPKMVMLVHNFDEQAAPSTSRTKSHAASELAVSLDGEWLAASRYGMGSGSVMLFSVPKVGGDYKRTWSLPALEAPPSCIKFLGGKEAETLAVGCSNNSFYLFDHKQRKLSDWSQDTGFPMSPSMPRELIHRAEYPTRMAFNPANPSKFLLVSLQKWG